MQTFLPPRDTWEQKTIETYDRMFRTPHVWEEELFVDDVLREVRAALPPDPLMLDVGCGYGRCIPLFDELGIGRYVGVDASRGAVARAQENYPHLEFHVTDLARLPELFGARKFDAFFSITTFMHILPESMPRILASLRSVMHMGGIGYILVPYGSGEELVDARVVHPPTPIPPEEEAYMVRVMWSIGVLQQLCAAAGFQIIQPTLAAMGSLGMTVKAV